MGLKFIVSINILPNNSIITTVEVRIIENDNKLLVHVSSLLLMMIMMIYLMVMKNS